METSAGKFTIWLTAVELKLYLVSLVDCTFLVEIFFIHINISQGITVRFYYRITNFRSSTLRFYYIAADSDETQMNLPYVEFIEMSSGSSNSRTAEQMVHE